MTNDRSLHDASKRIPKSIDTDAYVVGTYTLTDLAVGAVPGVVIALTLQLVVPSDLSAAGYRVGTLTLPLTLAGLMLGGVVVFLTPTYLTTAQWFGSMVGFWHRPARQPHDTAMAQTHVEAVHPTADVIERTDGAVIGLLQVTPPSMALATDEEWAATADAFREFLNTSVEFPIQLYATTRQFPADDYLAHYRSRRADPDVRANPQLARLIDEYIAWYQDDVERRQMTIRDHYIIVPVSPGEVRFERRQLVQQLTHLPVLGVFVKAVVAPRREDERAAMVEAVDERVRHLRRGVREMDGCDARRVEAGEAAELLASFWRGEAVQYDSPANAVTTRPVVGAEVPDA